MSPRLDPRELDRQLVPTAARALRRLLAGGGRLRGRAAGELRRRTTTAGAAAARLDDRATATGPLRLLRDLPQVAVLVVAAVFLAGTAAAVLLTEPAPPQTPAAPPPSALDSVVRLGVDPGSDVDLTLEQSRVVLDDVAERLPDTRLIALVHLSRYVSSDELLAVLEGVSPLRFYLRAPTAGPDAEIIAIPVQEETAATVLPALCAATSSRKAEDARNFATLAETIEPASPEEAAGKADFEAESVRAAAESEAFAGPCTTGFAAVVEGAAGDLRGLLERDGVRGVEVAPAGVLLADLDVQPLLPETTGVVPTGRER